MRGEPSRRRRFLDLEISQLSPSYCHTLACYRRVVEGRSRLLKIARDRRGVDVSDSPLGAWTEQLVNYGSRLLERRKQFLRQLQELAELVHSVMTDDAERLTISYQPTFRLPDDLEAIQQAFRDALGEVRMEEARRQVCLVGPHRDDITFLVNGRDVRVYGSQGQQRTVALSLKLAELQLMRDLVGESPVCLLDDVFSELDAKRRSHILDVTLGTCQTFLATTDPDLVPAEVVRRSLVLEVIAGTLRRHS